MFFGKKESHNDFFTLFKEAAENLVAASNCLEKITTLEGDERRKYRKELHEIEHSSDQITHKIHNLLSATFVTPLDRDDISTIAGCLDDCMDYMDEAGDLIVLYNLGDIPRRLNAQVQVLKKCSELTAYALKDLRKRDKLGEFTVEINSLENEGDKAYRKMLVELFESKFDPILIIKIKDIIESLERGCDSFEKLANVVETIFIKES